MASYLGAAGAGAAAGAGNDAARAAANACAIFPSIIDEMQGVGKLLINTAKYTSETQGRRL